MSEFETWVTRGAVMAVIGAIVGLFVRVRNLEAKRAAADVRLEDLDKHETADMKSHSDLKEELHELRLCLERNFVRRDDWVPHTTQVLRALESQGTQLARLEERLKQKDRHGA